MSDNIKDREPTLERWPGERKDNHRAMLLWAMQSPNGRSGRAVARAMGISDGSVRNWRKRQCWDARVEAFGQDSDQIALDIYRREYMLDYGKIELPEVAKNVVRPIGKSDLIDPSTSASNEARIRVHEAIPNAVKEVEQITAQTIADQRQNDREDAKRHIKLVDASLGLIARKLKDNEIRANLRDIPILLECRERLTNVLSGANASGNGAAVDSVRVKQAKANGTDVIEAMWEDVEELKAILGAIRTKEQTDISQITFSTESTA